MDENNNLKSEITRLNNIITVLLDQISALKAENSALKVGKGIQNSNDTVPDYYNGIEDNSNTVATSEKGTQPELDTVPTFDKGTPSELSTIATSEKGTQPELNTIATIGKGVKANFNTVAESGSAANANLGNAAINLPAHIEPDSTNVVKLAKYLRSFLPDTRQRDARSSIARELLLLHNASRVTSHELRKAAGLSKPGFAKHLPKLRRRGFIMREPPLKYKLTEMSRDIIAKVFG